MTNRIFEIKTGKTYIIKAIFECIKQYIKETNMMISPEGIKISTKDTSKTTLTYIKLDADKFESFRCERPVVLGIETATFFKAIKSAQKKEIMTLYMNENENDHLGIELSHAFLRTVKDIRIPLLDLLDNTINIGKMDFDYVINMPTLQFQQIIKDINIMEGKVIEIKSIGNQLVFMSEDSPLGKFSMTLSELDDRDSDHRQLQEENGEKIERCLTFSKSSDTIVQGQFRLSYFMNFIKAGALCDNMNIYLKNDKPIVLEYFAADLGVIKFLNIPYSKNM